MAAHNQLGYRGERLVAERLAAIGEVGASPRADVRVGNVDIEVKTASPSMINRRRRGYQFCLRRDGRRGVRAEYVVCVCCGASSLAFFVIPAAVVGQRKKINVPVDLTEYTGPWAEFLDRWDLITC